MVETTKTFDEVIELNPEERIEAFGELGELSPEDKEKFRLFERLNKLVTNYVDFNRAYIKVLLELNEDEKKLEGYTDLHKEIRRLILNVNVPVTRILNFWEKKFPLLPELKGRIITLLQSEFEITKEQAGELFTQMQQQKVWTLVISFYKQKEYKYSSTLYFSFDKLEEFISELQALDLNRVLSNGFRLTVRMAK